MPAVRLLLQDERVIPAVLAFLRGSGVGRMVALGSPEGEWEGVEEIVLRLEGEEG